MKTLNDYFDMAAKRTNSDRQTAIQMGIAPNRISMARKSGYMSNEMSAKLAEIIDINPIEIIAAAEVKKHPEKVQFWGKWIAASVILTLCLISNISFNSISYRGFQFNETIHYAQF